MDIEELLGKDFRTLPELIRNVTPIIVPWSIPVALGIAVVVGVVFGMNLNNSN